MRSKGATKNDRECKNNATSKPNLGKRKLEEKSNTEASDQNNSTVAAVNNKRKNEKLVHNTTGNKPVAEDGADLLCPGPTTQPSPLGPTY
eukprot:9560444-Ditylum_brightwellii.AAC.3